MNTTQRRIDRRAWLTRAGLTLAGMGGAVLTFGHGRRLGAVTTAGVGPKAGSAEALRVDLGFVSAYVITRGADAAVIDTGVAGSADAIGAVIQGAGLDWNDVRHVILTHYHSDHSGSAADILGRAPRADVWLGEADIPRVDLGRVVRPAVDGDDIFGLRVVATPGHTDGHISMLDADLGLLVVGDALVNVNGELAASPAQFSSNLAEAYATVRRLGGLSFERALFGHGDPIDAGAAGAFRRLGATLP